MKIVVKIGTASISRPEGGLDDRRLGALAAELAALHKGGRRVILVTSGAIGAGMDVFGWEKRPTALKDKQAAAAVGQVALMEAYKRAFSAEGVTVAQVLLTRADLEDRARYLNVRQTLDALLGHGVLPVLNENDTVATDEIQFGDNDTLSALIAAKTSADKLFLLTDVDGLMTNPTDGVLLPEVFQITPDVEALVRAGTGSKKSVGGMGTKVSAARLAMASGVETWIASGKRPGVVTEILDGKGVGTRFQAAQADVLSARRRWIASLKPKGALHVDAGAVAALVTGKKSLLPSGIVKAEGAFAAGDAVRVLGPDGREAARGLSAHAAADVHKIKGKKTSDIAGLLGRAAPSEVIHRNNLAVLG